MKERDGLSDPESERELKTLYNDVTAKFEFNPWNAVAIEGGNTPFALDQRQLTPLEQSLQITGYNPVQASHQEFRVLNNKQRGKIGSTEITVGTVELNVNKSGEDPLIALLLQYTHNPRDVFDLEGNRFVYSDGVANVYIIPDGTMYALAMLADGTYGMTSFTTPFSGRLGQKFPHDEKEALEMIGKVMPSGRFAKLGYKLALLSTIAADSYLKRERNYYVSENNLCSFEGRLEQYTSRHGVLPAELGEFFTVPETSLIDDLVAEDLIPEKSDVIVLDHYKSFIQSLAQSGLKIPSLFRSHELGIYASSTAPWLDMDSKETVNVLLATKGVDIKRGSILPLHSPSTYDNAWSTPTAILKHNLLLQVYDETLSDEAKSKLLSFADKHVTQAKQLVNHTYLFVDIPTIDKTSPYAFRKYDELTKHKYMAGFIAGIMTMPKDLYRYWAREPLWGDGSERWHWSPPGMKELLSDIGFNVVNVPLSQIYPPGVRGVNKDGTLDTVAWEYDYQSGQQFQKS